MHGSRAINKGKGAKIQNPTAGIIVSQQIWSTTVERVTINTWTTRVRQQLTTAWANQIAPVDIGQGTADLDPQTEAE